MNLFNAARKICEAFTYDPGHSDLDNEQPIAIHCTLGDWRRLNSALMLAGQRAEPEAATIQKAHDHLINLQPHIAQLPKGYQGFIDPHVDEAMKLLASLLPQLRRSAICHQDPATDSLDPCNAAVEREEIK